MAASVTNELMDGTPSDQRHETDCDQVVDVFEKWLKGKATLEDEEFLAAQVDECSPCFESIDEQQLFVKFLNTALARPGTPVALADSIKTKIHQTA